MFGCFVFSFGFHLLIEATYIELGCANVGVGSETTVRCGFFATVWGWLLPLLSSEGACDMEETLLALYGTAANFGGTLSGIARRAQR